MKYKKITSLLLTSAMVVTMLAGCGSADNDASKGRLAEVGRLSFQLPESFQDSSTKGLFLSKNYPEDMSNIYVYEEEAYADFDLTMRDGQEEFVSNLQDAYQVQYEETPEITVLAYEQCPIAGRNAYKIELSYSLRESDYYQLEYVIDAEDTYYIAFTQIGEIDYGSEFASCLDSLHIAMKDKETNQ